MAQRSDVVIDWSQSPRVITISAPSTSCTMQDLYDTLRFMEADSTALDNKPIVDASGKETLDDSGTKVGLTVSLQNAIVGFEPRLDWSNCVLNGGNLVSFNESGVVIDPINPTPYVNITRTSSASATLQEQDALQYASYGGEVSIDEKSIYMGTEFPIGTQQYPVNNIQDAVSIANNKGFHVLKLIGNVTLVNGDNVDKFKLIGQSAIRTLITIKPEANVLATEVTYAGVTGTLDGSAILRECLIVGLTYVNGFLDGCALTQLPIVLGGNSQGTLTNCFSNVGGVETPIIDMGGTGQSLAVRNYAGGIRIKNRKGNDSASIDMSSGHIIIDASCTGEPITCRGVFKLTVEVGATHPDIDGRVLMQQDDIAQKVWEVQLP